MTAPREILPGKTWLLTRRCTQRRFLLKPDRETELLLGYCFAVAAQRAGLQLIAWCFMSNHYHAVVHDPDGRAPEFAAHFHRNVAKVFNARWRRAENFWSTEETCMTYLPTPADVLSMVVYVLANPVAAHCVARAAEWPGLSSVAFLDGSTRHYRRPEHYFRSARSAMPDDVELRMEIPAAILREGQSEEEWVARVREQLNERESELRHQRSEQGRPVLGLKGIARLSHLDAPETSANRGTLRPAVACKDEKERIEQLKRLMAFREAYDAARRSHAEGRRNAVFPPGTYRMRLLGAPTCALPPPHQPDRPPIAA